MVNEYLTRAYDTKVIFRELLCFYAPFGWVPVKENKAPSPNAPVHKMYDGNTVWSMEKQDYVSDYDVGRKRSEKIVVKRNTKYTRNNRLMMEEAVMEYHLRFRYWLYPRCNRLRLINRCRPGWGSLWAILFLIFTFLTAVVIGGAPANTGKDVEYKDAVISCQADEGTVYSVSQSGPYFMINGGDVLFSENANGLFTDISGRDQEKYGVTYNKDTGVLSFSKNSRGNDFGENDNIYAYEGYARAGSDVKMTSDIERTYRSISVSASEKAVYFMDEEGPFYALKDDVLYYSATEEGAFAVISEDQAADLGVSFKNGKIYFVKDADKKGLVSGGQYSIYKFGFTKGSSNIDFISASVEGAIDVDVDEESVYSLSENGPFFKVSADGKVLFSAVADAVYEQLGEEGEALFGVSYSAEDGKIVFTKDANGNDLLPVVPYPIYKTPVVFGVSQKITSGVTTQTANYTIDVSEGYAYSLKNGRYYALKDGSISYCDTPNGVYVSDLSEILRDGVTYTDNKFVFKWDTEGKEFVLENAYIFRKTELYDVSMSRMTDTETVKYGVITVEVKDNTLYSVDLKGPFFKVDGGYLYISGKDAKGNYDAYASEKYTKLSDEVAEVCGVSYSPDDKTISFWKAHDGDEFLYGVTDREEKFVVYKTPDNFLGVVYKKAFVETIEDWFAEKGLGKLFDILCYVLAGPNALLLTYQLNFNWWFKKNTERIICCCVNA